MRDLAIAYGANARTRQWANKNVAWDDLCDDLKTTRRTPETVEQYEHMTRSERDAAKNGQAFVLGRLKNGSRRKEDVEFRSGLSADLDDALPTFLPAFEAGWGHAALVYSTHSHRPETPRYRVLVPLTRDVTPDEYVAISRYFAATWGIEQFDACSFQVNQLMYMPSTPCDGEYVCEIIDKPWLDPDVVLKAHPDWKDYSTLPISSREQKVSTPGAKQQDPLTKPGVIGAFCRTYTIADAIETFLTDVYEPCAVPGRYTFIPGEGVAGLVLYDNKFAYSHHATDPANGLLLNAFDLVRVHKFGDMDEDVPDGTQTNRLPSCKAMCEFAMGQDAVKITVANEKIAQASEDFAQDDGDPDSWKKGLCYTAKGAILENSLHNIQLILQNDPQLKNIVFNELADSMEVIGDVPWPHPGHYWRDADDAQLISYVDSHYGSFSQRYYDVAVTKVADDRGYHPIRQYFEALPPWDGTERVDTLLTDYLGAEDNEYTRAVCRKTLCAAYMRIYHPGIKFDFLPVLNGPQGVGKSTLIAKLGMEWFSDSLTLSDMNDKTAAEKLQGYWIHEIGELAGMKKADIDKVKAFISRSDDKYRAAFGRRVTPHPRQCVFIGTTNAEDGFLRDITGNRRFWVVKVSGDSRYKPWDMTPELIDQIWAEVAVIAQGGEPLYLSPELEAYAQNEQRQAMEQDAREGIVQEYLDMLLPDNWDDMDVYQRRDYVNEPDDPTRPAGTHMRTTVTNLEIWCECFGKPKEDIQPRDSYAIAAIMKRLPGWEKTDRRTRTKMYGQQRLYART